MSIALAAMISTAVMAVEAEKLRVWVPLKDVPTPTAAFLMQNDTHRTLADFKGQVVVLNLWATWCTPCLKELPSLDALEEKYAPDGLVVVPLSVDTVPFAQLVTFIQNQSLELPHLAQDDSRAIYEALRGRGLPMTYLIDREGKVAARISGEVDWLAKAQTDRIEALLR